MLTTAALVLLGGSSSLARECGTGTVEQQLKCLSEEVKNLRTALDKKADIVALDKKADESELKKKADKADLDTKLDTTKLDKIHIYALGAEANRCMAIDLPPLPGRSFRPIVSAVCDSTVDLQNWKIIPQP